MSPLTSGVGNTECRGKYGMELPFGLGCRVGGRYFGIRVPRAGRGGRVGIFERSHRNRGDGAEARGKASERAHRDNGGECRAAGQSTRVHHRRSGAHHAGVGNGSGIRRPGRRRADPRHRHAVVHACTGYSAGGGFKIGSFFLAPFFIPFVQDATATETSNKSAAAFGQMTGCNGMTSPMKTTWPRISASAPAIS